MRRGRAARPAAVLLVAVAVEALLLALLPELVSGAGRALAMPPETSDAERAGDLLAAVLVCCAAAAWTSWSLLLVLTLAGASGRRLGPLGWRTAAAAALGMTVAAGPAAAADPPGSAPPVPPISQLDGLPLPDRPVGRAPARTPPVAAVVVRPGDTLWDLAAATLPASPGVSRIDRTWRAWYAANRRTIGPDPDLLLPGQRLIPPREDVR